MSTETASESSGAAEPISLASKIDLPPRNITKRPGLFKLSLILFIGWLLFLAYVAYVVLK